MEAFLVENFFSIICCVAAFGVTYILRDINNSIKTLQKEQLEMIRQRDMLKLDLMGNIHEIKELISGTYVSKIEFKELHNEVFKQLENLRK